MMLRAFITATAIMTILPVGRFFPNEKDLHRSVDMFAVVGLLLAVIIWGVGTALAYSLPPVVLAAVMTVIPEFFTKGLHLDGLADTADGFLSSRSRERKLVHDRFFSGPACGRGTAPWLRPEDPGTRAD